MPKVRFYADVPEYKAEGWVLHASTSPGVNVRFGWKRVVFDVEMPAGVYRESDDVAPVAVATVVE